MCQNLWCGIWALAWTLCAGPADAAPVEAAGKVVAVTLYRGQALVTRTIDVEESKGSLEVVVGNLPDQVDSENVFAEGGEQLEVRAVRIRSRAVGEEPRAEVRKIEEAMAETQRKTALNQAQLQILAKRSEYLDNLEGFVAPTAKSELSKGVLDAEALRKVTLFCFEQRQSIAEEQVKLAEEARALDQELSLLQRQRSEIAQGASRTLREAVLFVEKQADGPQQLRLNYLVNNCGWSPSYTIRAGENRQEVQLEYNALIAQMTGEAWTDVALTLSTASPALSATGPGLAPFRVLLREQGAQPGQADEQDLLSQLRSLKAQQHSAVEEYRNTSRLDDNLTANWRINDAANELQQVELQGDAATLSSLRQNAAGEEPSLSYRIAGTVSLASRNDQQMVRIVHTKFPSRFYHVATPVLTSYVYREADLINQSPEDLLGGPLSVYLDGRFVGRGEIPTVARGQSFVVGFGADPQVRARRELADKSEGVQGGNRELQFSYRLVIENFKPDPVALQVIDRLPSSLRESDIRVTLGDMSDPLSEDKVYLRRERPQGILRWDVEVPGGATGENARFVTYQYRIEHDRNFGLALPGGTPQQQTEFEQLQRFRGKR